MADTNVNKSPWLFTAYLSWSSAQLCYCDLFTGSVQQRYRSVSGLLSIDD